MISNRELFIINREEEAIDERTKVQDLRWETLSDVLPIQKKKNDKKAKKNR